MIIGKKRNTDTSAPTTDASYRRGGLVFFFTRTTAADPERLTAEDLASIVTDPALIFEPIPELDGDVALAAALRGACADATAAADRLFQMLGSGEPDVRANLEAQRAAVKEAGAKVIAAHVAWLHFQSTPGAA